MADLDLQQQKELENHKGFWGMVAHLQKVGYDIPVTIIKTLLFMSGGAMIGILTFLGNLWTRNDELGRQVAKDIGNGLYWFGMALAASMIAAVIGWIGTYATSHSVAMSFFKGKQSKWRYVLYPIMFLLMVNAGIAVGLFLYAMHESFKGLTKHI
jgi:hypothetical protein